MTLNPEHGQGSLHSVLELSWTLTCEGRYEEQEALLRDAIVRFADNAELHLQLGSTLVQVDAAEAANLLRRAVDLEPNDPANLTRAGLAMFSLEEFSDASNFARRAVESAPPDFVLATNLAHLVGRVASHEGNYELAERLLTLAFKDDPDMPGHAYGLAVLFVQKHELARALEVVREGRRLLPDDESLSVLASDIRNEMRHDGLSTLDD